MKRRTRRLAAGIAALSVGATLTGSMTALAQSDEPDEPPASTAPESTPAKASWLEDALAPLVEAGTLTQDQADAVIEALHDARPEGKGAGPHSRRGGPGHTFVGPSLSTAAEAIGISEDDVLDALEEGQTLAEIAEDNGVEPDAVIDALVAEATDRLDEAVEDGRLDEADADERRADITERITEFVEEGAGPGSAHRDERPRQDGPRGDRERPTEAGSDDAPPTTTQD